MEKIERIKATRKPFRLEKPIIQPVHKENTQQLKSFISKLDENWKKIEHNLNLRNRFIFKMNKLSIKVWVGKSALNVRL